MESTRSCHDRGASLVEFALILPLLACLLLGIVTGGSALAAKNSMTNATREGARLGATLPPSDDDGTVWTNWATDVRDRVLSVAGGDLEEDEICAALIYIDATAGDTTLSQWPSGGCTLSEAAPVTPLSAADGSCIVKVWSQRTVDLDWLFVATPIDIESDAIGLYERSPCAAP